MFFDGMQAVGQAAAATRGAASSMMHRGEVLPHHQGVGRRLLFNRGSRVDHTIRRLDTSNAFWVSTLFQFEFFMIIMIISHALQWHVRQVRLQG